MTKLKGASIIFYELEFYWFLQTMPGKTWVQHYFSLFFSTSHHYDDITVVTTVKMGSENVYNNFSTTSHNTVLQTV